VLGGKIVKLKMISGGAWFSLPNHCRSAARNYYVPGKANDTDGFRVVCIPELPQPNYD